MSRVEEALKQVADPHGPPPAVLPRRMDATLEDYPIERENRPVPVPVVADVAREHPIPAVPVPAPPPPMPIAPEMEFRSEARRPARNPKPAWSNSRLVASGQVPPSTIEQYRRLAAALHEAREVRGTRVVMVGSALPHDGKTLTTINLALTLSGSYGQRVLLIDADLRRPSVGHVLGLSSRSGLSDVLRGKREDLPLIEVSPCFTVLTAGHPDSSPLAGLTSPFMKDVLERASSKFDWVLVDSPPIGLLPDAQVISRLVDAVLLVVSAGITPYQVVQRAVADVGADRFLGVVLNRAEAEATLSDYYESYYITPELKDSGRNRG